MSEAETTLEQDLEELGVDEEIEPESAPAEENAEQVESPELDADAQEKSDSQGSRDKRIAGFYAEKAENDRLRQVNADLERKVNQSQQSEVPAPNYDDFDTDAEYYAAIARHEATRAVDGYKSEQSQAQKIGRLDGIKESFIKNVSKANIPNYAEKAQSLADSGLFPNELLPDLWAEEKAPQLIVYLADHPEVTDGITAVELGKISARMSAPKPVQKTKASAPIKPTKPGGAIKKSMEDMSIEEIDAMYD